MCVDSGKDVRRGVIFGTFLICLLIEWWMRNLHTTIVGPEKRAEPPHHSCYQQVTEARLESERAVHCTMGMLGGCM